MRVERLTGEPKKLLVFHQSPDADDESCICSSCREKIEDIGAIIRSFGIEDGRSFELRFHDRCFFELLDIRTKQMRMPIVLVWSDED